MCMPISDKEISDQNTYFNSEYFATERLIYDLTQLRNAGAWQKAAAVVGYPLLALAVAIEVAVRTPLGILALIPAAIYAIWDGGKEFELAAMNGLLSWVVGIELVLRCTVGFFKNFAVDQLTFRDLAICQACYD